MGDSTTVSVRLVPANQYATPTTGATVVANTNGYTKLLLNPAGTLAALTITMPSSPSDGDTFVVASTQIITTLTMSGGTIINALTSMTVGAFATYTYSSSGAQWFRVG